MSAVAIPVIMTAPMRIMLFVVVPVAVVAVMRRMPVGPPVRLGPEPAVDGAMAVPVAVAVMRPVVTMVLPVPGGHVMAEIVAVICVNSAAVDDDRTDGPGQTVIGMRVAAAHTEVEAVLGEGGGACEK
jgi:hypothetical protein